MRNIMIMELNFRDWLEQRDAYNPKQALGILGMDRYTSQQDVRNRYLDIAKRYHPDVNKDPKSQDFFLKAGQARDYLDDFKTRASDYMSRRPSDTSDPYTNHRVEPDSPSVDIDDEVLVMVPSGPNAGKELGIGTVEDIEYGGHLDGIGYKVRIYRPLEKGVAPSTTTLPREWLHLIPRKFYPGDRVSILDYLPDASGKYKQVPYESGTIVNRMRNGSYKVEITDSPRSNMIGFVTWINPERLRHAPKQLTHSPSR